MKVLEFIKSKGLEALKDELAITVKERGNLLCLDYDQIESPRLHPVVLECRGLILEKDTYKPVFRSMERFFNYREANTLDFDYSSADYFSKVDGSLIKIYNYDDEWLVGTRGTIIADNDTGFGCSFQDLVFKALKVDWEEFQFKCSKFLNPNISYNFEVTSIENRVVTLYEGYTLHYLSSRDTLTGVYMDESEAVSKLGAVLLTSIFEKGVSVESVLDYVEHLPDLQEGVVAYVDGVPICKMKSTTYVEVHNKRGNGLSEKGIMRLVILQEHPEYLSYFPEESFLFEPYLKSYEKIFEDCSKLWSESSGIEDRKAYALALKGSELQGLLFAKRNQPERTFYYLFTNCLTEQSRFKLLLSYKDKV